jgi:MerR family transcriptional regulator, copper efflux regulator
MSMIRNMDSRVLRIGQVAARAGISADTVRHYERLGVIPRAVRTPAGYREYSESALERIRFVRNAVRFGFSLKQIGRFLSARESGRMPCREVRDSAARMAVEMDRQIDEMVAARTEIQQMLREWDQKLDATPAGKPARLLETLTPRSPVVARRNLGLNRRRR